MNNFFSDIKSWLKADYGGRYFALILRELIRQHPKVMFELIPNIDKSVKYVIEKEYYFINFRSADLAILEKTSSAIHALIEIKHEDEKNDRNSAQLADYLSFCKNNKIYFVFISKNNPDQRDLQNINNHKSFARHIRYSDIFRILYKLQNKSPISEMVKNFIKEEAIVFTNTISKKDVELLVLRGANVKHFHGLGKHLSLSGIEQVGNTLQSLLNNNSFVGQEFHNMFCKHLYKKSPTVSFCFQPQYNKELAKQCLEDDLYIVDDAVDGGILRIWNNYNLKDRKYENGKIKEKWYGFIRFGFEITLNTKNKAKALKTNLFSEVNFKYSDNFIKYSKINIERLDEKKIFLKIVNLNKATIKEGISSEKFPTAIKSTLNKLYKSLSS